jgi:hypothetical protein
MFEIVLVHRVLSTSCKSTMLPGLVAIGVESGVWEVEAVDICGKNCAKCQLPDFWELQNLIH